MKRKRWKHPEMVLLHGALGAIIGVPVGLVCFDFLIFEARIAFRAEEGWYTATSGVGGFAPAVFELAFSSFLGALTGVALVHFWGKYRRDIGFFVTIFASLMTLITFQGLCNGFDNLERRGFNLSFYGVYLDWSLMLLFGGIFMMWCKPGPGDTRYKNTP